MLHGYLAFATLLFGIGLYGLLQRRSLVAMLIAIELMIAAISVNIVALTTLAGRDATLGPVVVLIIVGVLVFIVGHLGNTALGLIGGGLQSLRLQYVEFFTKFYKGGGRKYNPFGMIKRFTED